MRKYRQLRDGGFRQSQRSEIQPDNALAMTPADSELLTARRPLVTAGLYRTSLEILFNYLQARSVE